MNHGNHYTYADSLYGGAAPLRADVKKNNITNNGFAGNHKILPFLTSNNNNNSMAADNSAGEMVYNLFDSDISLPTLAHSVTVARQDKTVTNVLPQRGGLSTTTAATMVDAGEQPQFSHNEALLKLRQKLSLSHLATSMLNDMQQHGQHNSVPNSDRFYHPITTNPNTSTVRGHNLDGNADQVRWPLTTLASTSVNQTLSAGTLGPNPMSYSGTVYNYQQRNISPNHTLSGSSRQPQSGDSTNCSEPLPLLPSNRKPLNHYAFNNHPSPPSPLKLQNSSNNNTSTTTSFYNSKLTTSFLNSIPSFHLMSTNSVKPNNNNNGSSKTRRANDNNLDKLPQLCALANSLQSVSSTSLIAPQQQNGTNNSNSSGYFYYHNNTAASDSDAVEKKNTINDKTVKMPQNKSNSLRTIAMDESAPDLKTSFVSTFLNNKPKKMDEFPSAHATDPKFDIPKKSSDLTKDALPRLLSKFGSSTTTTATTSTRKRTMNEESAAPTTATNVTESNNNSQTDGTLQKKSRFRIGSLTTLKPVQPLTDAVTHDSSENLLSGYAPNMPKTHMPSSAFVYATSAKSSGTIAASGAHIATTTSAPSDIPSSHTQLARQSSSTKVDDDSSPLRNRVMSPNSAIRKYGSRLSNYELGEIKNYARIYFVGQRADKIDASSTKSRNYGYDNEDGLYLLRRRDQIAYRFEIIDKLGQGSFGQVVRAYDHKEGIEVALKILRNRRKFYRQGLVEVKLLEIVKRKDVVNNNLTHSNSDSELHNVVHMLNHFIFRNHLCISFELLGSNLYDVLQKNHFQGFNLKAVRNVAHQILACLQLLRREHIIHCDLKPENILINPNRPDGIAVKVVDSGSGCLDNQKLYTYIQSRYYRSPEVIMGLAYTMAIDMWSLGCILSELHTGRPLFPGEDEDEQLSMMMEVLGIPPQCVIAQGSRSSRFFDSSGQPVRLVNSRGRKRVPASKELPRAVCTTDKPFLDFLSKSFSYDADIRLTPDEGVRHEFITSPQHQSSQSGNSATLATAASSTRQSAAKAAAAKNWTSKTGR